MQICPLRHIELGGSGTRLAPENALALPSSRWGWQPKVDGAFVLVTTDRAGRISSMLHRSGSRVSLAEADGLYGLATGLPDATLAGELECHTEAGIRARQARGWAQLHVFDAVRVLGRSLAREPYSARYGWLHRWQADVECYGEIKREDWWTTDDDGNAHGPDGRFVRPVPRDLRRLPIVPLARGRGAGEQLWREHVELGGGEGIVAVRLDAPLGARGAKRKVKPTTDTLDCTVLSASGGYATLSWRGHVFAVSARGARWRDLAAGDVVEVASDGFYAAGCTPRFPRIVRRRTDLRATVSA